MRTHDILTIANPRAKLLTSIEYSGIHLHYRVWGKHTAWLQIYTKSRLCGTKDCFKMRIKGFRTA